MRSIKTYAGSEEGVTLIEVLVSLVILSMFVVVLSQVMGVSVTQVFSSGERAKAVALAEKKTERIYAIAVQTETLDELYSADEYSSMADRLTYDETLDYKFCLVESTKSVEGQDDIEGTDVTVVTFYNNGQSYVEITTFLDMR
ncbi:MAG: prepilin-type N-terminal cleavage/methylation domain-containing protein [Bacillota bacterium]|nr:prepilin-type N-terminal cleavage/methylation domain-containing protein [Bacillota bacterium]